MLFLHTVGVGDLLAIDHTLTSGSQQVCIGNTLRPDCVSEIRVRVEVYFLLTTASLGCQTDFQRPASTLCCCHSNWWF